MPDYNSNNTNLPGAGRFATTHWSVVLAAGRPKSVSYQEALETLCRTYWFPLYAYLRRNGCDSHQAQDYTQAFFTALLAKGGLGLADPKRGKFRSFLLASMKHFLSNERARARAIKRGGGKKAVSLDFQKAETLYAIEPCDELSPERIFDRSWALTVLERTMARLQAEANSSDKRNFFEHLKSYLTANETSTPYRDVADKLNITQGAVRVAVHRLRKRYRELLRDEIAQTVTSDDQIDEEIRDLFVALRC